MSASQYVDRLVLNLAIAQTTTCSGCGRLVIEHSEACDPEQAARFRHELIYGRGQVSPSLLIKERSK